jgi:hypothetical protein
LGVAPIDLRWLAVSAVIVFSGAAGTRQKQSDCFR